MSLKDDILRLSGIEPKKELLNEYKNGGQIESIIVVCDPPSIVSEVEDIMVEATPSELFDFVRGREDTEDCNPAFYFARAKGAAKEDAANRITELRSQKAQEEEECSVCENCQCDPCECEAEDEEVTVNIDGEPVNVCSKCMSAPCSCEGVSEDEEDIVLDVNGEEVHVCGKCKSHPCACEAGEENEESITCDCEECGCDPCECTPEEDCEVMTVRETVMKPGHKPRGKAVRVEMDKKGNLTKKGVDSLISDDAMDDIIANIGTAHDKKKKSEDEESMPNMPPAERARRRKRKERESERIRSNVGESAGEDNGRLDTAWNAKSENMYDAGINTDLANSSYVDPNPDSYGEFDKVKIPSDVMSDLTACIKVHTEKMNKYKEEDSDREAVFCEKVVECLEHVQECLSSGCRYEFDGATYYFSKLMGPLQQAFPASVVKCLTSGGSTGRSLKDYFDSARTK